MIMEDIPNGKTISTNYPKRGLIKGAVFPVRVPLITPWDHLNLGGKDQKFKYPYFGVSTIFK